MPYRKYLNSFCCHLTAWTLVVSFYAASAVAQETGIEIAKETLRKINAIEIDTTAEDLKDTTTCPHCNRTVADAVVAAKHWSGIQSACQKEFLIGFEAAKKNNELEGFASAYASHFGNGNGNLDDLRWALACPAFASHSGYIFSANKKNNESPEFNIFAREFNKAIVEKSLSSPEYYKKIYWFTMWAGDFSEIWNSSPDTDVLGYILEVIEAGFEKDERDYEFWFASRTMLTLAYLCDWEGGGGGFKEVPSPLTKEYITRNARNFGIFLAGLDAFSSVAYDSTEARFVATGQRVMIKPEIPDRPFKGVIFVFEPTAKWTESQDLFPVITPDFFTHVDYGWNLEFINRLHKIVPMSSQGMANESKNED